MRFARYLLVGAIIVAATFLGIWLQRDAGLAMISWHGYVMQTSVVFGLVVLTLALFALLSLLWIIWILPRWLRLRKLRGAHRLLLHGLQALATGDFKHAQKSLLRASTDPSQRAVALWFAAISAESAGEQSLADDLLGQLREHPTGAAIFALQSPKLRLARGDIGALAALRETAQNSPDALRTLAEFALNKGRALEFIEQLPSLNDAGLLEQTLVNRRFVDILSAALAQCTELSQVHAVFNSADQQTQSNPVVVSAYFRALSRMGKPGDARPALEEAIVRGCNSVWQAYPAAMKGEEREGLQFIKSLGERDRSAQAYLAMANLHLALGEFAAASAALMHARQLEPDIDSRQFEAQLALAQGDFASAARGFAAIQEAPV
jgi:HemY protein